MPVVIAEMWEGRTIEQKKQLVESRTSVMIEMGIHAEVVQVIVKDDSKHNWGIGDKPASE